MRLDLNPFLFSLDHNNYFCHGIWNEHIENVITIAVVRLCVQDVKDVRAMLCEHVYVCVYFSVFSGNAITKMAKKKISLWLLRLYFILLDRLNRK